jgi:low temperature requirement protein LtrA
VAVNAHTDTRADADHGVTVLELFFDLVFVFAITQVTTLLADEPTWTGMAEALAILAVLWSAWTAYAWLANSVCGDGGAIRIALFAAMGAILVLALSMPEAFGAGGLVFGVAYLVIRTEHIGAYLLVARGDVRLQRAIARLAFATMAASVLLVLAGGLDGTGRVLCWAGALLIEFAQSRASPRGWAVHPEHLAERYGLAIMIALGESVVALGVGAERSAPEAGVIVGALLGMATAAGLWWAYFDVDAIAGARGLRDARPTDQVLLARDAYTYLHFPLLSGVVFFAFGVKHAMVDLTAHLALVPAVALGGGIATYLVASSAFRHRTTGASGRARVVVSAIVVALVPAMTAMPALASVAAACVAVWGLVAVEVSGDAEKRRRVRLRETPIELTV